MMERLFLELSGYWSALTPIENQANSFRVNSYCAKITTVKPSDTLWSMYKPYFWTKTMSGEWKTPVLLFATHVLLKI